MRRSFSSPTGLSRVNQFLIERKHRQEFIEVTTPLVFVLAVKEPKTKGELQSRLLGIVFCRCNFLGASWRSRCSRRRQYQYVRIIYPPPLPPTKWLRPEFVIGAIRISALYYSFFVPVLPFSFEVSDAPKTSLDKLIIARIARRPQSRVFSAG